MHVKQGNGTTSFGPGVIVELTGDEVATAIDAWLVAHGVHVRGPRTVTVNGEQCEAGLVYVDPSGFVVAGGKRLDEALRAVERLPALVVVFARHESSGVDLVTDGVRWGVRLDGTDLRWHQDAKEARQAFAEHVDADAGLDRIGNSEDE